MPGRCVGPSRPGRGVRRPWGKGLLAGTPRGRGARRRARASLGETRCVSAEKPQRRRRPRGRNPAAGTAEAAGPHQASGASREEAREPGSVWVNGAVGQPQVVGPAGAVWVTGPGEEPEAGERSPRGNQRKGRPGSVGQDSILELWLKVQALRAATGHEQSSRVELHPVPAGEGPVERGVPGRASWVETSRAGVTGPWVEGQAREAQGIPRPPSTGALRAFCARVSGLCGLQPPARVPAMGVPGTLEARAGIAPQLPARGQAAGVPGAVEIGYGVVPGSWGKGPLRGVPGTGWPEVVEVPTTVEGAIDCGSVAGLWERGQAGQQVSGTLVQEAACGDTPGLWGRGQAAGLPDAVQDGAASLGGPGVWLRRQPREEQGIEDIPALWGTGQPVGVPCAVEEETRYGGDPGFRDRGQARWVETGSGGDPGSWEARQTVQMAGPEEQEAGPAGAPGFWGTEQTMRVPQALGKEVGCGAVPSVWRTEQPLGVSQAVVAPGVVGQQSSCDAIPGLWARQQTLAVPVTEAVPGVILEKPCCGNALSLWEQRQALEEQEVLVPPAFGAPGPVNQETDCRDASCLCRRSQAMGLPETMAVPEVANVPKHRCTSAGAPIPVGLPGSERVPARVPAAVWVSGPMCQELSSGDVSNPWERVLTARMPVESGAAVAPEELWAIGENTGAGAWGRRQALGVPVIARISVASEVPGLRTEQTGFGGAPGPWGRRQNASVPAAAGGPETPRGPVPLEVETGSGAFSGLPGRTQTTGVPVIAGVFAADGVPRPVPETDSGGVSSMWGERETVAGSVDARCPTRMGMPLTAGVSGPIGENGLGSISDVLGGRQTAGVPMAVGLHTARGMPGLVGAEMLSGSLADFPGRQQTLEIPMASGVAMDVGVSTEAGLMEGVTSSRNGSGVLGRTLVTEVPVAASAPGSVEEEPGSDGVSDRWRRRPNGTVPEGPVRGPLTLGVLAAVGVPITGRMPAAVWVTGPAESTNVAESGLTAARTHSIEGVSGEESGDGSILEPPGRRPAVGVSYSVGPRTRLWSCPRSQGEGTVYENVPGVVGPRITGGVPETLATPPDSSEETGIGYFRERGRTQAGVSGFRVRGSNLGANCGGEDRLRESFQK
ncbi:collagen alpha-1(IV) chain [Sorex araneus]|uniref:collagen alpha-1(IV) chain n=1 Tax=Sorex araneus TaxID=42254 RepID=UPI002433FF35|nr:collagen alpha-1(IV) chain [Sorex araneus]